MRFLSWLARNWFLLALIALAALAVPGLILVVLTLLGWDRPVNAWLQENLQVSYALALAPGWALLLLTLPLVLLLLYFLKLKRKPLAVPSTYLWKKSIEDLHVNTLFQWLRNNLLLVLQIFALLFLIYSVLGLRLHGATSRARHYVLMIDNSASMACQDVAPSRLDWAKDQALKEIDAATDDDFGMVIVFNSKATTLQTYTNNRGRLREAVRSVRQTQKATRIEEALALAESLANPVRSTEEMAARPDDVPAGQERSFGREARGIQADVHLYSDGRFATLTEQALAQLGARQIGNVSPLGNLNLHYHAAGTIEPDRHAHNVGIVGLNAVRYIGPGAKAARQDVQKLLVLVNVLNYNKTPATVKLKLDVYVDGALTFPETRVVKLAALRTKGTGAEALYEPGGPIDPEAPPAAAGQPDDGQARRGVNITLPALDLRRNIVLHAYLDGVKDIFPTDDQAWLAIGTARKAKVLLVTDGNKVLDSFFSQDAARRLASVERMKPAELTTEAYRIRARSGDVDLVLFDRCAPAREEEMPQANTLFIGLPPPPWERGTRTMQNPLPVPSRQAHPLLRYLTTLWDVRIAEAFLFDVKKNLSPEARRQTELPEGDPKRRTLPTVTRVVETASASKETAQSPPLIFTLPRGPYTDVVLTFPLLGARGDLLTDWPLQTSFPLFFRNVLYTLGNVDDAVRAVTVQPGEPMVLRPEAGVTTLVVTAPDGTKAELKRGLRPDFVYGSTDRIGVYTYHTAQNDAVARNFAVNLLDPNESDVAPLDEIRLGSARIAQGHDRSQPREIWKWILLIAAALLAVEWMLYSRRISV